jgi:conjugal transfer pilus assembly protein TraK
MKTCFAPLLITLAVLSTRAHAADDLSTPKTQPTRETAIVNAPVKRVFDPVGVNPSVAVKKITPPKQIVLPGVAVIPGEDLRALDFTRSRKIQMNDGTNQTVYLSANDPNRIQLPFANPHVIGTSDLKVQKRPGSNNVYVSFIEGTTRPSQIFFESPDGTAVLGLQLLPKNIPGQVLLVEAVATSASATLDLATRSDNHTQKLQALSELVANNGVPTGYSVVPSSSPPIFLTPGVVLTVSKKFSSLTNDIFMYAVSNPGPGAVVLRESDFDGETVQSVSIHPSPSLAVGEVAKVIVIAQKPLLQ